MQRGNSVYRTNLTVSGKVPLIWTACLIFVCQGCQPGANEKIGDLHYGLLVYVDGLDARVPLGPEAKFVRAVCRRQGQESTLHGMDRPEEEYVNRITAFGQLLKQAMSQPERESFETAIKDGYIYQVETGPGKVTWRSSKRLAGQAELRRERVDHNTTRFHHTRPPETAAVDLELPAASVATILRIPDLAVRDAAVYRLSQIELDDSQRQAVLSELMTNEQGGTSPRPRFLVPIVLKLATKADGAVLDRLLSTGKLGSGELVQVFVRLAKLDPPLAVEHAAQRATAENLFYLVDYTRAQEVAQWPPTRITDGGNDGFETFIPQKVQLDPELRNVYRDIVLAFLKRREEERLYKAIDLIKEHFPELKGTAAPILQSSNHDYFREQGRIFSFQAKEKAKP